MANGLTEETLMIPTLSRFQRDARRIFHAAIYGVQPSVLIRKNVTVINEKLHFKVSKKASFYLTI